MKGTGGGVGAVHCPDFYRRLCGRVVAPVAVRNNVIMGCTTLPPALDSRARDPRDVAEKGKGGVAAGR